MGVSSFGRTPKDVRSMAMSTLTSSAGHPARQFSAELIVCASWCCVMKYRENAKSRKLSLLQSRIEIQPQFLFGIVEVQVVPGPFQLLFKIQAHDETGAWDETIFGADIYEAVPLQVNNSLSYYVRKYERAGVLRNPVRLAAVELVSLSGSGSLGRDQPNV
jgi:hypothetical protein